MSFVNFFRYFKYLGYLESLVTLIKSKASSKELVTGILDLTIPLVEANNPAKAEEIQTLVDKIKEYLSKN